MRAILVTLLVATLLASPAPAEELREVTVAPEFRAGGWFRFLFGDGYRDLWTTPIRAPVLDLRREGGGLRPTREIGHLQTLGLAFQGADGRAYTFRCLQKHPERILPPEWRDVFPGYIVRDATSRTHPAAGLILPVLAEAAGVPHTRPRLVILPDDPALGEFRDRFANKVGTFEEYPRASGDGTPGFMGATEILSTGELWARGVAGPETRVDSRAYLRARILDLWLDNYDRHAGQWRWMRIPGERGLQPLPEDPDMALVHHDGWVMSGVRNYNPRLLRIAEEYSRRLDGPLLNAFALDRWLLADRPGPDFEDLARELQARFTDQVIEEALGQMPPEWRTMGAPASLEILKARREKLVDYVRRVYRYYAREVEIHATDRAERVTVSRADDDALEVTLSLAGDGAPPYYRRRFVPEETREIRIHLHGGDDHVERTGPARGPIRVRVIAAGGAKVVDDSRSGGTDVWRDGGTVEVRRGRGTKVRPGGWTHPDPKEDTPWAEPRSWGHWTVPQGILGWVPDIGVVVGAGFTRTSWAFRSYPHRAVQTVRAAYGTGARSGKGEYIGRFRPAASRLSLGLHGYASGIERVNFFGFGNDTPTVTDRSRYKTDQSEVFLSPTVRWGSGSRFEVFLGGDVRYSDSPDDPSDGTLLGEVSPYGAGPFGSLVARGGLRFDTREPSGGRPRVNFAEGRFEPRGSERVSGVRLALDGFYVPAAWDVVDGYGALGGEVAGYLGNPRVHLAFRGGGRQVCGTFAWFDAAFLGGRTARAYRINRFAGDRSLYGSAEVRGWLTNLTNPVVPVRLGVFGFAETGRVWFEEEDSTSWHESYGGGLLFQPLGAPITLHATVATGDEGTRFYFGSGLAF
jgi:hypothetical protein